MLVNLTPPPSGRIDGRWPRAETQGPKEPGLLNKTNNAQCVSSNNTIYRIIIFMNMYACFIIIVVVVRRRDGGNRYWTLLDSSGRKVSGDRFCLLLLLFFCSPFRLVSVCSPTHPGHYVIFEKKTLARTRTWSFRNDHIYFYTITYESPKG